MPTWRRTTPRPSCSRRRSAFPRPFERTRVRRVKVDGPLLGDLRDVGARAERMEADGYSGAFTFEGPHDPFFPLLLAAEHTERLELSTAIAVAFARNPMILANIGYDLHAFSGG